MYNKHSLYGHPTGHSTTKEEFIDGLKELYLDEWKRHYDDTDVFDGFTWELGIDFASRKRAVKFEGCNAVPYNFRELTEFLGVENKYYS